MRLHDYQKLALQTLNSKENQLLHSILGISGEVAEVIKDQHDKANTLQEIGDTLWYIAIGCDDLECDMEDLDLDWENGEYLTDDLVVQSGILTDRIKRTMFYKTELPKELMLKCFGCLIVTLGHLAQEHGSTLEYCMEKNIAKLKTRYPEGFSEERAVNRNVTKEERHFCE